MERKCIPSYTQQTKKCSHNVGHVLFTGKNADGISWSGPRLPVSWRFKAKSRQQRRTQQKQPMAYVSTPPLLPSLWFCWLHGVPGRRPRLIAWDACMETATRVLRKRIQANAGKSRYGVASPTFCGLLTCHGFSAAKARNSSTFVLKITWFL